MKLILLGPPGSGKGTLAAKLSKEFKLFSLSAGELLRKEAKTNKRIARIINKGKLIPSKLSVDLVKKKLKNKTNYILDGFPRSLDQAKAIRNLKIDILIYLDVSEKVSIERLSGRRICQKGIHTYHIKNLPPKKTGICDYDGTKLIHRKDDQPKVIKERFRVYHKKTEPLIKFYRRILKRVNGSQELGKVFKDVKRIIN